MAFLKTCKYVPVYFIKKHTTDLRDCLLQILFDVFFHIKKYYIYDEQKYKQLCNFCRATYDLKEHFSCDFVVLILLFKLLWIVSGNNC